ncbi:hypothetical protein E2C01_052345 [Portunus trituberculatus]|uniref:Uncharacterized protein n=1 Tax=Portunus trituberculatus TaxID=210409 RepID=A0A5B7GLA7_PORTR|nr:hypothetical protein [Portunus trituberculatus]
MQKKKINNSLPSPPPSRATFLLLQSLLTALIRGSGEVSEESARQFEAWWAVHVSRPPTAAHVMTPPHHVHARPHPLEKLPPEPLHPAIQVCFG